VLTHPSGVLYLSVSAAQQETRQMRLDRGQVTSRPSNSELASACRLDSVEAAIDEILIASFLFLMRLGQLANCFNDNVVSRDNHTSTEQ